jgi:hypothetical protein
MESYIIIDTIIKDEIYEIFSSSVTCRLCNNIYINPIMCIKCQNVYCKRCIDNWCKNEKKCPNQCESPDYRNCLAKNDILSKLKFSCVGCGEEIGYYEAEKHHNSCCPNMTSKDFKNNKTNEINKKKKLEKLSGEQIQQLREKGNEVTFITGM